VTKDNLPVRRRLACWFAFFLSASCFFWFTPSPFTPFFAIGAFASIAGAICSVIVFAFSTMFSGGRPLDEQIVEQQPLLLRVLSHLLPARIIDGELGDAYESTHRLAVAGLSTRWLRFRVLGPAVFFACVNGAREIIVTTFAHRRG
jgi:hypothetical protein